MLSAERQIGACAVQTAGVEPVARDTLQWRVFTVSEVRGLLGLLRVFGPWNDRSPWWLEIRDRSTLEVFVRLRFSGSLATTEPLAGAVAAADEYLARAAEVDPPTFRSEFEGVRADPPRRAAKYVWRDGEVKSARGDDGWS